MVMLSIPQEEYSVTKVHLNLQFLLLFQVIMPMITSFGRIYQTAHQTLSQMSMRRIKMVPTGIGETAIRYPPAYSITQLFGKAGHYP